jgi:GDP-D-mannose dehydratase
MMKLGIFNGTRVLITGHTGFKGSWLSLWLSQLEAEVYGVFEQFVSGHGGSAQRGPFNVGAGVSQSVIEMARLI